MVVLVKAISFRVVIPSLSSWQTVLVGVEGPVFQTVFRERDMIYWELK